MTVSTGWPAPAKINRFLHVVGRRDDGYHLLETVFQFLDHGDELAFRVRDDGVIARRGGLEAVPSHEDLTVRAARRLAEAAGVQAGAEIVVDKRVPAGGGLGGGSSDAATTLVALNSLWGVGWSVEQLAALALELGADVPVFVRGEAAWAEGVGERLTPLLPDEPWCVVVDPGVSVSTAAVFAAAELTRDTPRSRIPRLEFSACRNDCEPVVRRMAPTVGAVLDWLGERGPARMSGSGGCCFGLFESEGAARAVAAEAPAPWQAFVARVVNRSPLAERARHADAAGLSPCGSTGA